MVAQENIRPVLAEANAKRYGHILQARRLDRSLLTETASNLSYFGLAAGYYLLSQNTLDLKSAFIGAVGVTTALLYKRQKARHKIKQIEHSVQAYNTTKRTSTFDPLGLTFRGNRPLNTDDKHEAFHLFHNPLHLGNSIGRAIDCTWTDVVMRPTSFLTHAMKTAFTKESTSAPIEFHYANDACCENNGVVMRTKLAHINNDATVQMPASERRLDTSIDYTHRTIWKSFYSDYAELAVNLAGAAGAAEFCWSVGEIAAHSGVEAYTNGSIGSAIFAAASCITIYVGTDPLQNFLDDCEAIHTRLNAKLEILKVKKAAISHIRDTVSDIKQKIHECSFMDVGIMRHDIEAHKSSISELLATLDTSEIPAPTQAHLKHRGISIRPELNTEPT